MRSGLLQGMAMNPFDAADYSAGEADHIYTAVEQDYRDLSGLLPKLLCSLCVCPRTIPRTNQVVASDVDVLGLQAVVFALLITQSSEITLSEPQGPMKTCQI